MTPAEEDALIATARKRAANEGTGIVTRDQVIRLAIRAAVAAERERDGECICKGNWRKIVSNAESMIGKQFYNENGDRFTFFGVVHGDDDYYYGMFGKSGLRLLSCVSGINGHGFTALAAQEGRHD